MKKLHMHTRAQTSNVCPVFDMTSWCHNFCVPYFPKYSDKWPRAYSVDPDQTADPSQQNLASL